MRRLSQVTNVFFALWLLLPTIASTHAQSPAEDAAEVRAYVLTMDSVQRTYKTVYEIRQAVAKDPGLKKLLDSDVGSEKGKNTLTAITARYSASAAIVSIAANNGFTPRELIASELALAQAGLAAAAVHAGAPRDKIITGSGVSAANLDFVVQHQTQLDELGRKYANQ